MVQQLMQDTDNKKLSLYLGGFLKRNPSRLGEVRMLIDEISPHAIPLKDKKGMLDAALGRANLSRRKYMGRYRRASKLAHARRSAQFGSADDNNGFVSISVSDLRKVALATSKPSIDNMVAKYVKKAPKEALEKMLTAPESEYKILGLVNEMMLDDMSLSTSVKLKLKGLKRRRELIDESGGAMGAADVMDLTGWTKQTLKNNRDNGYVLFFVNKGSNYYPWYQFNETGMIKGMRKVIKSLFTQGASFWSSTHFLLNRHGYFGADNLSPLQAIKNGRSDEVVELVKTRFDQTAY